MWFYRILCSKNLFTYTHLETSDLGKRVKFVQKVNCAVYDLSPLNCDKLNGLGTRESFTTSNFPKGDGGMCVGKHKVFYRMTFFRGKGCTESVLSVYGGTNGYCSGSCLGGLKIRNDVFTNRLDEQK